MLENFKHGSRKKDPFLFIHMYHMNVGIYCNKAFSEQSMREELGALSQKSHCCLQ